MAKDLLLCTNCRQKFKGQYCNFCGQKIVHRITLHTIWHDAFHYFTHLEKGFLPTMGALFTRPGEVTRGYIVHGQRKKYFNPLSYLLIICSAATFFMVSTRFTDAVFGVPEAAGHPVQKATVQFMSNLFNKYFTFIPLFALPVSAFSTYLIYRKQRFNFAEMLTLHAFISGQSTLIGLAGVLVVWAAGASYLQVMTVLSAVSGLYMVAVLMAFFQQKNAGGFFRASAVHLLNFIVVSLLVTAVAFAVSLF